MTRVVIIGGGPAGLGCAQTLAKSLKPRDNVEVMVLEKSKFFYHAIGAPRAYVEPSYVKKLFIPYDHAIPKNASEYVKILRAVATGISSEKNEVSYKTIGDNDQPAATEQTLKFDYLIIATGSTYAVPINQDNFSRKHTEAKLQEVIVQVEKAERILIVGGGAVGCEVAGEIKTKYPNKSVTIIEARDKLVSSNNVVDKFRVNLKTALDELDIKVILGERLPERMTDNCFEKRTLTTNKGTKIESDIQLLCAGFSPVAELVKKMDPSLVADNGFIRVNDAFQLDDDRYAHMFSLGDACNHATPKMSLWAGQQATHLAKELVQVLHKKQKRVTKPFDKITVEALMLPLGINGGVSQLPMWGGVVVGDWVTRFFKSWDMFATRIWSSLGATVPE